MIDESLRRRIFSDIDRCGQEGVKFYLKHLVREDEANPEDRYVSIFEKRMVDSAIDTKGGFSYPKDPIFPLWSGCVGRMMRSKDILKDRKTWISTFYGISVSEYTWTSTWITQPSYNLAQSSFNSKEEWLAKEIRDFVISLGIVEER